MTDPVEQFIATMRNNAARVDQVSQLQEALPLIDAFVQERHLPSQIRLSPALAQSWPATSNLETSSGTTAGDHKLCGSEAWAAIADTGTLVLMSGPDNPTRLNFLADFHLIRIRTGQIVANKSAIWKMLEQQGTLPRAINFISGPSRTADIEQTIQLGAHGPRFLWVLVTD